MCYFSLHCSASVGEGEKINEALRCSPFCKISCVKGSVHEKYCWLETLFSVVKSFVCLIKPRFSERTDTKRWNYRLSWKRRMIFPSLHPDEMDDFPSVHPCTAPSICTAVKEHRNGPVVRPCVNTPFSAVVQLGSRTRPFIRNSEKSGEES